MNPRRHTAAIFALAILCWGWLSGFMLFYPGQGPGALVTISSVALSNNTFDSTVTNATVGDVSVILSAGSFSGTLAIVSSGTDHSGTTCTSTNGANFQLIGTTVQANGTLAAGTYPGVCVQATQASASNSPYTQAFTVVGTAAASVAAIFQNGQTFVTWPDQATGSAGNSWRYSMYRSTSPLNAGNCTSGTLIASHIFNNSAQLFGGDPTINGGNTFTQANRQNAALPMSVLSFGGTPLPVYSGLQVYTATATQSAYYCIMADPQPSGSSTFVGAAGPVSESATTIQPVKYADSQSRGQSYGKINCLLSSTCSSVPIILRAHASEGSGGAPYDSTVGDYWEWWLSSTEGYQDGRSTTLSVVQDNGAHFPGQSPALEVNPRDTWWTTDGTSGLETEHWFVGMSPNPLVGVANRIYLSTLNGYQKFLNFVVNHYGGDINNIHWTGTSMGAWGGVSAGVLMTNPRLAGVWVTGPMWRRDHDNSQTWPGKTWQSSMPFAPSLGTAPNLMGTNPTAIQLDNGATWGGDGGYVDIPSFLAASPGVDLPFLDFVTSMQDPYTKWSDEIAAINALQSAHRGHAMLWDQGGHSELGQWPLMASNIDCDQTPTKTWCYHKSTFKRNQSYLAFSQSSIDDSPGTATVQSNGLYDGDISGCINCGFHWSITSDTSTAYNFTVGNTWMTLSPTVKPATTLTGAITATTGGGTVTVSDGTFGGNLQTIAGKNSYFLLSNNEVITVTGVSGNTVTYTSRAQLGTTGHTHAIGDAIQQIVEVPTGPNGGPYTTMSVDVTPRRRQGFRPNIGDTVTCTITPNGSTPSTTTVTVDSSALFTLPVNQINSSGDTAVACVTP